MVTNWSSKLLNVLWIFYTWFGYPGLAKLINCIFRFTRWNSSECLFHLLVWGITCGMRHNQSSRFRGRWIASRYLLCCCTLGPWGARVWRKSCRVTKPSVLLFKLRGWSISSLLLKRWFSDVVAMKKIQVIASVSLKLNRIFNKQKTKGRKLHLEEVSDIELDFGGHLVEACYFELVTGLWVHL